MKNSWKLASLLCGAALMTACGSESDTGSEAGGESSNGGDEGETTLVINSFTDELQYPIEVFEERNPGVNIDLQIIPTENYVDTLRPALESGSGAPDIFTGEIVYLLDWIEQDYWMDLNEYDVDSWSDDYLDYVWELGRNEAGEMKALSWQTTPGGIYYRRSIAEEVFGTDDPDTIGEQMSTMEGLMEAGAQLEEAGYRLFPDEGSIGPYTMGANPVPWVNENNELQMTDERLSYFDYAKELRDNQYTALAPAWSPAWYASFNEPITYNAGWEEMEEGEETTEVFGVSLPTWGLHSVLKTDAQETAGDWAVTNGPSPYFQGGSWIGIYEGSENKDVAFDFIQMLVNDEEFLTEWVEETGDVLSYKPVMEKVAEDYSDDYLGGQNHYEFFLERAEEIDPSNVTRYDQRLDQMFGTSVGAYVDGVLTKDEALEEFYAEVQNAFPNITVPESN
ncbi:ABC-type glycerol-3-phosphate transport system, substrate-binding protein [Alkalibacterium putridalgicola]|uniref:ABC transporter substrate-binding protein n=1 Tax=Alkalibacterium putridalgicola TaxID=426703 RepID=A0A1H7QKB1_9LACT|nr:ABC transporter substrate-binding protein [Alkalibacterium putridalgicola]GEK88433.1 ABC transporter substrate-binding protein [Alkalibacterium putridalgicola]SEL48353.1 ABC-type glycerol-3-phosphate transport system, substrate-binding protein [Alkalibacterium putridalgicola]